MSFIERDLDDELIDYLNSKGYMPILVPRVGFAPPTVYTHEGERYIRQADLIDWLKKPELRKMLETTPQPSAALGKDLNGKKAGKASLSFSEKLAAVFSGGASAKIKAAGDVGNVVSFKYTECTTREVAPDTIKQVLKSIPADRFGTALAAKKVHIAYEYLYARKIDLSVSNKLGGSVDVGVKVAELGAIEVGGEAKKGESETTVFQAEENAEPVAIAFKVAQLTFENGGYDLNWQTLPGTGFNKGAKPKPYLTQTGQVYEITDAAPVPSGRSETGP